MLEDGDRILNLFGIGLVLLLIFAIGVLALNFDPPEEDPAPGGNWSVERVNDSHIEVTRTDGEPVPASELRVTVDSVRRNADWTDPVVPGTSVTVAASDGALVRVVWIGSRGNRATLRELRV